MRRENIHEDTPGDMEEIMKKDKKEKIHVIDVVGVILCLILIPILAINLTLIAKSMLNKDEVPRLGGYFPLIVLTDSMYPEIESGDLIICRQVEPEELEAGDIISFFDPEGNGNTILTHRIESMEGSGEELLFTTRGDANNTADAASVPAEKVVGVYLTRIPDLGHVAMFMQTSTGLIVCVVLPLVLMIAWDMIRRRMYEKKNQSEADELRAELEALKAARAKQEEEK